MALTDTLTTREALRRATLEDIVARCELAATSIEGGELDGIKVVSMGVLRDEMTGSLLVKLAPPSNRFAEVSTPATITVSAICPECDLPVTLTVKLTPLLTVDDDGAEISIKAKAAKMAHQHGQLSLDGAAAGDQLAFDDVVIDDLRLRILRAIDELQAELETAAEAGQVLRLTIDAIAIRLEYATESDRSDLEDSLYRYSQLEAPLVEVVSVTGEPVTYQLTQAGADLVSEAEEDGGEGDDPDPDKEDQERIDRDDP